VEEGDIIAIDIPARSLSLEVSEEELGRRRQSYVPKPQPMESPFLSRYRHFVTSGTEGAVLRNGEMPEEA
jgi:dihydroxy-acid dehydratase